MSAESRDSGRRRLGEVPASLDDYVTAVFEGMAVEVELSYGRLFARRRQGLEADVAVYGSGGGFAWRRTMQRRRLRKFLHAWDSTAREVRRGPVSEVWPLGGDWQ